jgi:hypothetical protein
MTIKSGKLRLPNPSIAIARTGAGLHLHSLSLACRGFWRRLVLASPASDCIHLRSLRHRLRAPRKAIVIDGSRYCLKTCLEVALGDALRSVRLSPPCPGVSHRVPLGLLLLSRQQLSVEQLRAALETQRAAGRGKIGEWLQAMGFVDQQQVTSALARQWACPVLRTNSPMPCRSFPQIPTALLASFSMVPVGYARAGSTLHLAFGERIDYSVLYAIEQMTGCRTEPCMAVPSLVRQRLRALPEDGAETEMVFDRLAGDAEFSRIIRSYAIHVAAREIRLAACGRYLWVRLLRRTDPPLDLLLREAQASSTDSGLDAAPPTLSVAPESV